MLNTKFPVFQPPDLSFVLLSVYNFSKVFSHKAMTNAIHFLSGIRLYGDQELSLVCVDRSNRKMFICSSFSELNEFLEGLNGCR